MALKRFYPWGYAESVFSIDYQALYALGYRGLIFDIDNTLVHHGDNSTPAVDRLFQTLHAMGFQTLLLSNNEEERVLRFMENIHCPYLCDADKPNPKGFLLALERLGINKEEALVIGDQVFTDIFGANRCSIPSILVKFIRREGETKLGKRRRAEQLILWCWHRHKASRKWENICNIKGA